MRYRKKDERMKSFCEKCMKMHGEDELCPHIAGELKRNPELLTQAATFANVAGQYRLVTSQDLNVVAGKINQLVGSNLSFEGTHQYVRDIQVFRRLNEEAFSRLGVFSTPEAAQQYLKNITEEAFKKKLTGSGQEVDWLLYKKGQISSIWSKSRLYNGNAAGVDGDTINRFTGKTISRTTIKATTDSKYLGDRVREVQEAIDKGTATKNDIIYSVKGTKETAEKAGLSNKVIEQNTIADVNESNKRLIDKIKGGKANTNIVANEAAKKMMNGAIIGAAVSLTISSITCYIKYRNGEISQEEAFRDVGEDTTKGTLTGAAMAGITLFLPGGAIGLIGGMAIGIYLNSTLTNVLDEVFGKGAYREILISSGYVMGMSQNLLDCIKKIEKDEMSISQKIREIHQRKKEIDADLDEFDRIMKGV